MRLLDVTLALAGFSSTAFGAAVPKAPCGDVQTDYDAIIVGGGPAGLSALSGLARVRRKVLLIDSGKYRNAPTRHAHDVIGFDGVTPAWYRYSARKQIATYDTIKMTNGTVTKIEAGNKNTCFTVLADLPEDKNKTITARKVVLATGLKDDLPDTPGLKENFGKGIYWCPWCDGHEHADQGLGLLGDLKTVPGAVREMLTLNKDIMAFVNGSNTPENQKATEAETPEYQVYLEANNVTIENRVIREIVRLRDGGDHEQDASLPSVPEHDLFRVDFNEGPSIERNAFLGRFHSSQASQIGVDMGVQLLGRGMAANSSAGMVTNIPGVYAVGDANSDNSTNIPHALFSGKRCAVSLHVRLAREDQDAQIKAYNEAHEGENKRSLEETERDLWTRMNGEPDDILYAGEYDQ